MEKPLLADAEILVVEDERMLRKTLGRFLEKNRAQPTLAENLGEAREYLNNLHFDFALIDINLPDGNGLDLLRDGAFSPNTHVVVMTANEGVPQAVEAMRLGASDYLNKPFDPEELPIIFQRCKARNRSRRREEHQRQEEESSSRDLFWGNPGEAFTNRIERILETDRRLETRLPPVLIEGETGTGKTTVARYLHKNGPRAAKPCVEINCSTLPEALAESELFGHEQGAFTDAKSARIGLFEAADQGTLFLDEIPSLNPAIQAKLLVAIEDGMIRRVGGSREVSVDVRIIAAANQSLETAVEQGLFREDLYHRLNLLRLTLPPLRERREDLPDLARFLTDTIARRYKVKPPPISSRGRQRLLQYRWPGNIRELAHELERQMILQPDEALDFPSLQGLLEDRGPEDDDAAEDWLTPGWQFPESGFDLEQAEKRLIRKALDQTGGNVSRAARLLGVSRDFLRYRLESK